MNSLKKIYDLEVTPPNGVWKRIAQRLNQMDEQKKIATKIQAIEIEPPAFVWENISEQLNQTAQDNTIAAKLNNITATPPPKVWNNIYKALDEQAALDTLQKKLINLQATPPAAAWSNIEKTLAGKVQKAAPVIPFSRNYGWLKYVAAACFVAVIGITALFIFKEDAPNGAHTAQTTNVNTKTPLVQNNKFATPQTPSAEQQSLAGIRTKLGNAYTASNERNKELQNRYILLMTQDGNIVRMSKKVSNMADCIAGEDHSCDDQISKWQKEMATSTSTSAPANFLDILDMTSDEPTAATNEKTKL